MMVASFVESTGMLLTILTPLVAVPLTVITFYLRSLREHQVSWHADLVRRMESAEAAAVDLRKMLTEFERDYTTKEEWLREGMMARRTLEQLRETTVRIETTMQSVFPGPHPPLAAELGQTGVVAPDRRGNTRSGNCDEGNQ